VIHDPKIFRNSFRERLEHGVDGFIVGENDMKAFDPFNRLGGSRAGYRAIGLESARLFRAPVPDAHLMSVSAKVAHKSAAQ